MNIINDSYTYIKYKCPKCNTVFQLDKEDINRWNDLFWCECPKCYEHLRLSKYNFDAWLRGLKKLLR